MHADLPSDLRAMLEAIYFTAPTRHAVCDHCDGERTEIVVGIDGYEWAPCSWCDATGMREVA